MAIGFIVLITVLAGSVGNTVNTAIIGRITPRRRELLYEAETALSQGWDYVFRYQDGLDPTWLDSAGERFKPHRIDDRSNCLTSRVTSVSDYFIASQVSSSTKIRRRYFVRKDGNDYFIFGCARTADTRRHGGIDGAGGFT